MRIKKFNSFKKINEDIDTDSIKSVTKTETQYKVEELTGNVTLFRLTASSVIDLANPGEYYVCDESDLDPSLLDKSGPKLTLITVNCSSDNIDLEKSKKECEEKGSNSIVDVKDDSKCNIISATPFTK